MGEGAVEPRLEQVDERLLAEEADADRGHRDPDLAGRERLVDRLDLLERLLGPGLALGGERLDAALAGPDERELGGDEQPVDRDEQKEQDEEERGHCSEPWGAVLRGRSSSTGTGQR